MANADKTSRRCSVEDETSRIRFAGRLTVAAASLLIGALGGCKQIGEHRAEVQVAEETWPGLAVPLRDVEICEAGTDHCTRTDADGWATLYVPVDEEVILAATKEGYQSELYPFVMPTEGTTLHNNLSTEQRLQDQFANVSSPYPMVDTGMLSIIAPYCEGATIEVFGAPGKGKRVYLDDDPNLTWNPNLEATSGAGIAAVVELPPGEYRVEIGGAANHCTPLYAWPGPFENSVRVPVKAGFLTESWVSCDCE
jgi:hypothetical protein